MNASTVRLSTTKRYGVVFAVLMGLVFCLALPSAAWAETAQDTMQAGASDAGYSTQANTVTKEVSMTVGDAKKMSASGLKVKKATWKSSNKKVATVKKGKVKAVKAGTATITATQGKKVFKFKVTVKASASAKGDVTVTGAEINDVVLETEFFEDKYGDAVQYIMHLKVKDGVSYDTWSKKLKPIVSEGATYRLERFEVADFSAEGYTVEHAMLYVSNSGASRTYVVEAFPASSVYTFGVFEGNSQRQS